MSDQESEGFMRRGWRAWTRFWFTPADPTPLCLMRIFAGILTLYVHLAYSIDLVAFFGPNGWYGQKEANESRTQLPHVRVRNDWRAEELPIMMPSDPRQREVLRQYIHRLLGDPQSGNLLTFMSSLGLAGSERGELLRYLEKPMDKAARDAKLQAFVDDKMSEEEKTLLPQFFLHQTTPESRQRFVEEVKRFDNLLPTDASDRKRLMELFLQANDEDWGALRNFIESLGSRDPSERDKYLDFLAVWGVPYDRIYAFGMQTYSPWFHTSDVRYLWLIHGLHLCVILLFTLGMYTRVTSVMTWLVGLAYIHRGQPYLFGQDTMMTLCLFYLMFSPCGAKWSLDRWMEKQRAAAAGMAPPPVEPSIAAGFVIRLFQIQYCMMYLSAGVSKLKGRLWWNGMAFFECLANPEFAPMHLPIYRDMLGWLCNHRPLFEIHGISVSYFTLFTELAFPFLIWTRLRPIMVALAILLHTGIAMIMGLSIFSLFMFCLLLCWFPPEVINWMFESDARAERSAT